MGIERFTIQIMPQARQAIPSTFTAAEIPKMKYAAINEMKKTKPKIQSLCLSHIEMDSDLEFINIIDLHRL